MAHVVKELELGYGLIRAWIFPIFFVDHWVFRRTESCLEPSRPHLQIQLCGESLPVAENVDVSLKSGRLLLALGACRNHAWGFAMHCLVQV